MDIPSLELPLGRGISHGRKGGRQNRGNERWKIKDMASVPVPPHLLDGCTVLRHCLSTPQHYGTPDPPLTRSLKRMNRLRAAHSIPAFSWICGVCISTDQPPSSTGASLYRLGRSLCPFVYPPDRSSTRSCQPASQPACSVQAR